MANDVSMPHTLANGEGNIPDADELNDNFDKCNDKIYVSATAPTSPYEGQMWYKTGVAIQIALRVYDGSNWYSLMTGGQVE